MNCPACNFPGAYVGLKRVECLNDTCRHYVPPAGAARPRKKGDCGHDSWVALPVVDLSHREQCIKCGNSRRKTLISMMPQFAPGTWYYD